MKKRIIAFFSAFLIFFLSFNLPVYAVGNSWSDSAKLAYFNDNFGKINSELNGVYFRFDDLKEDLAGYFDDHKSSYGNYTSIDDLFVDDVDIYFQEGSSGNSNVSFGQTFRQCMRDWCNAYIDANSEYFYGYSLNSGLFANYFDSTDKLNKFLAFIESHEDENIVYFRTYNGSNRFVLLPLNYIDSYLYISENSGYPLYDCRSYNNGELVPQITLNYYSYDDTAENWVERVDTVTFSQGFTDPLLKYEGVCNQLSTLGYFRINLNAQPFKIYKNASSLQLSNQRNPFMYVSGSYNTTISGSYNTTTENIDNSITYTIINNYNDDYFDDNNRYPTPQEIKVYINVYVPDPDPTPTPDPNPTPTPDPNPDPGGDDDNEGNLWDFLQEIGRILGNLIATLGEVVAGLISGISSIITSLITSFPNVIGGLIEYFLPFLPDEIITVISLSIILSIIVGIIKLIRG